MEENSREKSLYFPVAGKTEAERVAVVAGTLPLALQNAEWEGV